MASPEDEKATARRRRANGDGTTWQDKYGQWWAALRFEKGQRPYKVRALSEKDAERKLSELRQRKQASLQAPNAQTVEQWLTVWMRDVVMVHTKRKTQLGYRQHIENYLLPILGDMRLDALRAEHIRALQAKLLRKKLAPSTINGAHTALIVALNVAVDDRIIPYNPAATVKKLKVQKREVIPLTPSEAAAIRWAVEGHRLEALYHLAFLGLRKGELLGIRLIDLDMKAGTLRIAQQAVALENGTMVIETLKTDNAYRTLPLSPALLTVLRHRLEMLLVERGTAGWQENGLLFPSERGTILLQRSLDRNLARTLNCAGITRPWSWHKFRHTVISWLGDLGVTDEITKAIAGHGDKDVTDRYRHIGLAAMREALERMESIYLSEQHEADEAHIKQRAWQRTSSSPHKERREG